MGKYYAVKSGKSPGIYTSWEECRANVERVSGAEYKSFATKEEAEEYMGLKAGKHKSGTKSPKAEPWAVAELSPKELIAYVDGSYNSATGEYGSGVVLLLPGGEVEELICSGSDKELASMRNVAGEIKASEKAMRYALDNKYEKITIYHDYEGIAKWCQGLWKTNKEGTIAYKKMYDNIAETVKIDFVKVKGHSGNMLNDRADSLAKKAANVE